MTDKKVISIRFHTESKEDMNLYERLEQEAGTSASLAFVVKSKLKDFYNRLDSNEQNINLQDKMITVVREEMHEFGIKLIGAILSGMGKNDGSAMILSGTNADSLPEKSEELPYGALEFLE